MTDRFILQEKRVCLSSSSSIHSNIQKLVLDSSLLQFITKLSMFISEEGVGNCTSFLFLFTSQED